MKNNLKFAKNRYNTESVKWDLCDTQFNGENLLPMWVADMDISTAKPVIEAVKKKVSSGIFGYSFLSEELKEIVANWLKKRNGYEIFPDCVNYAPGVGSALHILVRALTDKDDNIIIQTPVYHVFAEVIRNNKRKVLENPLKFIDGKYEIDFEDLESKLQHAKMIILSSPHNPVGKVFTKEELQKIGELCVKYRVFLVSDEVHSDLTLFDNKFVSTASISPEIEDITITCTSPSKAFNLAGLQLATIIIKNQKIATKYLRELELIGLHGPNSVASVALKTAYTKGENWLNNLKAYLEDMTNYIDQFLKENIPQVKLIYPQATYLLWLDFRALNLTNKELDDFILHQCKLALNSGYSFGENGSGFMRMNIATSRENITKALISLKREIEKII